MDRKFLDIMPVFIYHRDRMNNINIDNEMTLMLPITKKDEIAIRSAIACDENVMLSCGLQIDYKAGAKRIKMFGETDSIPMEAARNLGIEKLWYASIKDAETRECNVNDNGFVTMTQIYDPLELVKLGVCMLGNPERIIVAKIKCDVYETSKFYINVIKLITHGKD